MIPLRAENPRRSFAVVNMVLIALNIAVFSQRGARHSAGTMWLDDANMCK